MTLPGEGFIALWNDILPHRADYDAWHTIEHVPERMTVDGFLSAHRYVLEAGGLPKYFTLYALGDLAALNSESYLRLIREPTAQTRGMRPDFRGFLRLVCRTSFTRGVGVGGFAAACLLTPALAKRASLLCESLLGLDGMVAVHFGEVDAAAAPLELGMTGPPPRETAGVLIVEGYGAQALARSCEGAELGTLDAGFDGWSYYKLAFELRKGDLGPCDGEVMHRRFGDEAPLGPPA
jgi:hypothetical protein